MHTTYYLEHTTYHLVRTTLSYNLVHTTYYLVRTTYHNVHTTYYLVVWCKRDNFAQYNFLMYHLKIGGFRVTSIICILGVKGV